MKHMRMRGKIYTVFGLVLVMAILMSIAGFSGLNKLNRAADTYANTTIPAVEDIWTARRGVQAIEREVLEITFAKTPAELAQTESDLLAEREKMVNALEHLAQIAPQFQTNVDNINLQLQAAGSIRAQIVEESGKFTEEGDNRAYEIFKESFQPTYQKVIDELRALVEDINAGVEKRHTDADKAYKIAAVMAATMQIAMVLLVVYIVRLMIKEIVTPVHEVSKIMTRLAAGRFNEVTPPEYESEDEIGDMTESIRVMMNVMDHMIPDIIHLGTELGNGNFNVSSNCREMYVGGYEDILKSLRHIRNTLDSTVEQIDDTSEQLMSGANQVASGAQALSQGATEQASSVEELAAAIAELEGKVKQNAENAEYANSITTEAMEGIEESNTHMNSLMQAMNDIEASSNEINRIIKTIDDIAFQTNILALNAAVEAARAGAAGKGFAVVADEVRNLAQKSAEAAKNTTTLIENSVSAVQAGIVNANDTAQAMRIVVEKAEGVAAKVQEISQATEEQADRITQISVGIDQISAVTQTISATSEESAAASEELASQANILKEMTGKFTRFQGESGATFAFTNTKTKAQREAERAEKAAARPAYKPVSIPSTREDDGYAEYMRNEFGGGDDKY